MLVAGRHRGKVQRTMRELRGHTGNRRVFGYCYDLGSFEQTRTFAQHIKQDLQQHFNGRQVAAARLNCPALSCLPARLGCLSHLYPWLAGSPHWSTTLAFSTRSKCSQRCDTPAFNS